jgi:hypothetical protein
MCFFMTLLSLAAPRADLGPGGDGGTTTTDTLCGSVRHNEEVIPVNVTTWVLLCEVTVGR